MIAQLRRMLSSRAAVAVALVAILAGGAAAGAAASSTEAAWSDRAVVSATVTSGTWKTPTSNTCVAYSMTGKAIAGCAVTSITYLGWGDPGTQVRNYYIDFAVPSGTHHVTFGVDLTTATGNQKTWSWAKAGIAVGAQFTPTGGWTCANLPTLTARSADWQSDIYFAAYEDKSAGPVVCK